MQQPDLIKAVFEFVLLIFSLSVHECAHAWMASRLGDQTARLEGRITLNPMYHVDPIGSLLFPAIMIFGPFIGFSMFSGMLVGWAKPTPVITRNFRKIVRDDNLTTLAGPVSNLLMVLVADELRLTTVRFPVNRPSWPSCWPAMYIVVPFTSALLAPPGMARVLLLIVACVGRFPDCWPTR